ncbi:hypothetical protein ACOMHN_040253 [Nucella lapillus]
MKSLHRGWPGQLSHRGRGKDIWGKDIWGQDIWSKQGCREQALTFASLGSVYVQPLRQLPAGNSVRTAAVTTTSWEQYMYSRCDNYQLETVYVQPL